MIYWDSDYLEGAHECVLKALHDTNSEQSVGYGMDSHCANAASLIRHKCGLNEAAVHFTVGGTSANTIVISACLKPYEGVLCADSGHINTHETGAIEACGHKVLAFPGENGKISAQQVREAVEAHGGDEHVVKPGMIYISHPTELGTLYSKAELSALYDAAQDLSLYLYIDGARLGYGLASPSADLSLSEIAALCDVFTIGATKVGALFGEAIVIKNTKLHPCFRYYIKQHGALLAKGRLLGVQFETLMTDFLYEKIAQKAVSQALRIREALEKKHILFLVDSPTNQQFPILPLAAYDALTQNHSVTVWDRPDAGHVVTRICTGWATTDENVDRLIADIISLV